MQCERFEDRLNEVLDTRQPLSAASDLSEHIRQCATCRALARSYEAMLVGLSQLEVPPEPAWLTPRVLGQLGRPSGPTVLRPSRVLYFPRRSAFALAAAAVLIAIGLPLFFNRGGDLAKDDQPAGDPLIRGQGTPQIATTDRPGPSGATLPSDRRPRKEADDVQAAARSPLATALLDPSRLKADDLIGSLPAAGWAHDVADGLEPVTKPTVGAINGFLQLWGVGDEGRRS